MTYNNIKQIPSVSLKGLLYFYWVATTVMAQAL